MPCLWCLCLQYGGHGGGVIVLEASHAMFVVSVLAVWRPRWQCHSSRGLSCCVCGVCACSMEATVAVS